MSGAARIFASDRACLLSVVLLALLLTAPALGRRDLWDPDEPRTALVTRGLFQAGSWAAPRLEGRLWLEKPPLYHWLATAVSRAAGRVDETTVRLPANAAALLCAVVVFHLGRALWGRRAGVLAAVVLLTTEDFVVEARWARPDMLLGLLLTFAALAAWKAIASEDRPHGFWVAGFWAAVGLGVLTKGPVALLPIAGAIVFAAASRRLALLGRLRPLWGLPVAAVPVALWLVAWQAAAGGPFPLAEVLARFGRRLTEGVHHARPAAHILTTLPLAFLPWSCLLPAAVAESWPRRGARRDDGAVYLFSCLIAYGALFALSAEKRGVYLLPMVPLVSILIGRLWDARLYRWEPPPPARLVAGGFLVWCVAVVAAAAWILPRVGREAPALLPAAAVLAGVALLAATTPLLAWRRHGAGGAIGLFAAGAALSALVVVHAVLPALEPYKSPRGLGTRVASLAGADPAGIFPDPHAGIAWYAGRDLVVLDSVEALGVFLGGPHRALVVAEEDAWERAAAAPGVAARVVERGRVGHRGFVLVEPEPPMPAAEPAPEAPRDAPP